MKVRKMSMFQRLFFCLAILLLLANGGLGIFIYDFSSKALFRQIQSNAKNIAKCAAVEMPGELLKSVLEKGKDSLEYAGVMDGLILYRDNLELEYIYTLGRDQGGDFHFLVDPDPENPADVGEYCEPSLPMELAFENKETTAEETFSVDEWGTHISAYSPVLYEGEVVALVGVDISADWIEQQNAQLSKMVLASCICTAVISIVVLQILMVKFRKNMRKLDNKMNELANGCGDLTKEIDINTGDELELIAVHMNAFLAQMRGLVGEVAESARDILQSGEEMNSTVNSNIEIIEDIDSHLQNISKNMGESSDSSQKLSQGLVENSEYMADFAEDIRRISVMVQQASEEARKASGGVAKNRVYAMERISFLKTQLEEMEQEAAKIEQVQEIAEQIGRIAGQTRILSVNAQIEAARAGTAGAGFAIVATQIGTLSSDIDAAVNRINDINNQAMSALKGLTSTIEQTIDFVSDNVAKDYDAFANLGEEYGSTTDTICVQVERIESKSREISGGICEISQDIRVIADNISHSSEGVFGLVRFTEEIKQSLNELNQTAQKNSQHSIQLKEHIAKYIY